MQTDTGVEDHSPDLFDISKSWFVEQSSPSSPEVPVQSAQPEDHEVDHHLETPQSSRPKCIRLLGGKRLFHDDDVRPDPCDFYQFEDREGSPTIGVHPQPEDKPLEDPRLRNRCLGDLMREHLNSLLRDEMEKDFKRIMACISQD